MRGTSILAGDYAKLDAQHQLRTAGMAGEKKMTTRREVLGAIAAAAASPLAAHAATSDIYERALIIDALSFGRSWEDA